VCIHISQIADFWVGTVHRGPGSPLGGPAPPPGGYPVCGYLMPVNRLVILTPYMLLMGIIGAIAIFVFIRRKHRV